MHCLELPEFKEGSEYWSERDAAEYILRVLWALYNSPWPRYNITGFFPLSIFDVGQHDTPLSYYVTAYLEDGEWLNGLDYQLLKLLYHGGYRGTVQEALQPVVMRYTGMVIDESGNLIDPSL